MFHRVHRISYKTIIALLLISGGLVLSCSSSEDDDTNSLVDTGSVMSDADNRDNGSVAEKDTGHMAGHHHTTVKEVSKDLPIPTLAIEVLEDPVDGWNLHAEITNFRLSPENASTVDMPGEGHMHLYIDGVKVARLYSSWYHISELTPGERIIRVSLQSNDHAELAVDGEVISDSQVLIVSGTPHNDHDSSESSRYDADVADADVTIPVEFFEGEVHTPLRVTVDLGSVVALNVQTDISDSVHVHGYDILNYVDKDQPAYFAFNAQIHGTFEVELENSGILLLQLTIS